MCVCAQIVGYTKNGWGLSSPCGPPVHDVNLRQTKLNTSFHISLYGNVFIPWDSQFETFHYCLDLNVCTPKIHMLKSYPLKVVLGSGALEACLGHKGKAFMDGIRVLTKETPSRSPALLPHKDTAKRRWP